MKNSPGGDVILSFSRIIKTWANFPVNTEIRVNTEISVITAIHCNNEYLPVFTTVNCIFLK